MTTMGDRLKRAIKMAGTSQSDLARKSGIKQQTISYLIASHSTGSGYAVRLATSLGVNPLWLQEGVGDPHDPLVTVAPWPEGARASWVVKVKQDQVETILSGGEIDGPRVVTSAGVGPNAFAMDVHGRAMAPEMREGDEIIVDRDVRPDPGDLVVAIVDGRPVLRRWRPLPVDAGGISFELAASNPDYPAVSSRHQDCLVVGVVVEHRRRLK
jgi:SOS-response transcriptional repressor LexA